jgi:hypothetical protein
MVILKFRVQAFFDDTYRYLKNVSQYKIVWQWITIWFYVPLKNFHLYGDVTIAGEGLQNLGLCSVLKAFEQGGIFIVTHLMWHGTLVFQVSSEGPPQSVASYDTHVDVEDLF